MAEDYGIRPFEMEDLRPLELAQLLDHLDMKAAEAKKAGNA